MEIQLIRQAARVAHEVNRAYCSAHGDLSHKSWSETPREIQMSAIDGVQRIIDNPTITAKGMHYSWKSYKLAEGWVYGPEKDFDKKTHPCICDYEDLSPENKVKDELFIASVKTVLGIV